jgi:dolichol-phosphate mannosyltransferase
MKTVVTIPTYNEAANIGLLLDAILDLRIEGLSCLVVDDDSPDGTAKVVEEVAVRRVGAVELLVRKNARGRGTAGIAGFKRALAMGAAVVVEMDADFSHDPRYLPQLLDPLGRDEADLVIGSRFVPGGRDIDRGAHRRLVSWAARHYVRLLLGVKVEDVTAGYRAFSAALMRELDLDTCRSRGPSLVEELLFRAHKKRARIVEVPIEFKDRTRGASTLTARILAQTLFFVASLRWRGW